MLAVKNANFPPNLFFFTHPFLETIRDCFGPLAPPDYALGGDGGGGGLAGCGDCLENISMQRPWSA